MLALIWDAISSILGIKQWFHDRSVRQEQKTSDSNADLKAELSEARRDQLSMLAAPKTAEDAADLLKNGDA